MKVTIKVLYSSLFIFLLVFGCSGSNSNSDISGSSESASASSSIEPSSSASESSSASNTSSPSPTASNSASATSTLLPTSTATILVNSSPSTTASPSATATATASPSATVSPTPTVIVRGYLIGNRPVNEIPDVDLDSYYTISGSTVTKGKVVIILFADPVNESAKYLDYLKNVQTVISNYNSNDISVVGVLYQYNGELDGVDFLSYWDTLTTAGVTFTIVNNNAWNNSAAFNYNVNISSTPYIYLISKNYLIASKNPADIAATVATLIAE